MKITGVCKGVVACKDCACEDGCEEDELARTRNLKTCCAKVFFIENGLKKAQNAIRLIREQDGF